MRVRWDYISIRDDPGEDGREEAADVGEGERDADHCPGEHRRHVGRTYLNAGAVMIR